ncbi:MAG: amino-acid N-acetyltransferase [Gammaproteobacteria bacterium]|nr:amino-acid N-acetyltransferase [Gammaproteobacteria bacterium]
MKNKDNNQFAAWFRQSSPYIQAHRGKTFVVCLPGEAISSKGFNRLVRDLAQISHLGIRLVVVHGIRPQIEACLGKIHSRYHNDIRITDDTSMTCVRQVAGSVRLDIESQLSRALANLPVPGAYARTASGNYITARPYGVHEGVDFCHTGIVRRVDTGAISHQLDAGAITLISPIGFSPTGEVFNLSAEEVAESVAIALTADKLIIFSDKTSIRDSRRRLIRQLTLHEAQTLLLGKRKLPQAATRLLEMATQATDSGVRRVHILDWHQEGAILHELFSRDGVGTLISAEPYDTIRAARAEDISGIVQIIEILETSGALVKRQRDLLETEIDHFLVAIRDDTVIGCAAVYPHYKEGMAELACLAMDKEYQGSGSGEQLLNAAQARTQSLGINRLFVLTTQTAHWFRERGFIAAKITDLPMAKRRLYNYRRNAKVFIKEIG